jgi:GT2 family glycosyltransferase
MPIPILRKYIPKSIKKRYRLIRARLLSIGLACSGTFSQPEDEVEASRDMSVIVPILDSPKFLIRCLHSLEMYAPHAEIILVDDGSIMQETLHILEDFHHRNNWLLIRNDKSVGHSRACEAGAHLAIRPYLCFLNSDTVVTPWSWSGAERAFKMEPKVAVTGPSTSWTVTKQSIRRAEYCRNYWTNSQIYAFAKKYISKQEPKSWIDLPSLGGFALFIRRSIWEEFAGFDTGLPDYGNESELCKRLSSRGFRIIWTKNSYIHHFGQASYGRIMNKETMRKRRLAARAYIDRLHTKNNQR